MPEQRLEDLVERIQSDALEDFAQVFRTEPDAPLDRWRRFLEMCAEPGAPARVAVVHNDFAAEHVVDPASSGITGVIDWSDIAISDPVVDFAGIFHWAGERLVRDVLGAYEGRFDEQHLALARYMAACRSVMDVAFGLEMKRPEYVTAVSALCASAPFDQLAATGLPLRPQGTQRGLIMRSTPQLNRPRARRLRSKWQDGGSQDDQTQGGARRLKPMTSEAARGKGA